MVQLRSAIFYFHHGVSNIESYHLSSCGCAHGLRESIGFYTSSGVRLPYWHWNISDSCVVSRSMHTKAYEVVTSAQQLLAGIEGRGSHRNLHLTFVALEECTCKRCVLAIEFPIAEIGREEPTAMHVGCSSEARLAERVRPQGFPPPPRRNGSDLTALRCSQ